MKKIFQEGEGVICSSKKEVMELLQKAQENGYKVFETSLNNTLFSNFYWDGRQFIGSGVHMVRNAIKKDDFLSMINGTYKKVLGYKCPETFYNCVPKGSVFTKYLKISTPSQKPSQKFYSFKDLVILPSEIVEKWEPVYDEEIKIRGYECEIKNEKLHFGCQSFSKEELKFIEKLISSPIGALIKIDNVDINHEMLESINRKFALNE